MTQIAEQQQQPTTELPANTAQRRYITGRYRVVVEALEANGEARGRVVAAVRDPAPEELAEGLGPRNEQTPPQQFHFIGGLPGELIELDVSWSLPRPGRKRAKHPPAPVVRVHQVVTPAPDRVAPPCGVFGECGGCQLQHLAYSAQLRWKTERVRAMLASAGFSDAPVAPALGCDSPWGYRNHMRFSVNREGQAGLTARGTHRVLPLRACPIAHPRINDALDTLADEHLPQPQALIRYAEATAQMLLQPPQSQEARERLRERGLDLRDGEMEEGLGGVLFRIRPSSFFQTNTRQANRMMELVLARLPGGPDATLVDAYCGVGTFARLLAERAGRVVAIEESASAIRDARWNLRDTPNVEIVQAKVEEALPQMADRLDGLVIDPPRAGCQRPVLDALLARRVPRVVYVSCNPDTLARDLAYLCQRADGYRIEAVQPLDMFPQTAHIETVATLEAM
ncbi:MAG: class I SAM-dependent RNA methyltransferase [Ktedonobacterales bacterium]